MPMSIPRTSENTTTDIPRDELISRDERLSSRLQSLEAAERERLERTRAQELARLRELQTLD
ncbi:MAG: hypothetical protein U0935_16415 [Pirellulales bacterium]